MEGNEIEKAAEELQKLKEILKSDSVYWALRNAVKSPSTLGDVEDDKYIDLYNIICELHNPK